MRTPRRVKQRLLYSTFAPGQPIYDTDEQGNIIYDIMPDGVSEPRVIGEEPARFIEPIEIWNSISEDLTEVELQAFGTEPRSKAKMTYRKDELTLVVGDVIWKDSEVDYKSDGSVNEESADYRVIGVQTTGRVFHKALLEAVT